MDRTKLRLSELERRLVDDPGIILTKNAIISKVFDLFGYINIECLAQWENEPAILRISPKISRGENYEGLPYVVLDFPRLYAASDTLAIRYFFWWGNFFSVTLHLKGSYQRAHAAGIASQYPALLAGGYHVAVNPDEWQHHFGENNYRPVRDFSPEDFRELCEQHPFIKISRKFSLSQWDEMPVLLRETGREMRNWIGGEDT